jgi:hypothetical protein
MRNKISGAYSGIGGFKGVDVAVSSGVGMDVDVDIERRAKRLGETVTGITWLGGV